MSNYDKNDERPLPIGENKKVISLFKDELGGKIMKEFCARRAKAYAYSMEDGSKHKKAKETKKCIIKRELMFENYKDSLFDDKKYKITLSNNDDKRMQTFDRVTTYPYGTNVFKVCENGLLRNQ